jgi:nucleoside-diphosphate-sugar epimerase
MKIFLTGGAGDLGQMVCASLLGMGHTPVIFDVRKPASVDKEKTSPGAPRTEFVEGSITERAPLAKAIAGTDIVVHIAAWHGIHEARQEKSIYDFWDLNVGGTFNVFQAAFEAGIKNVIFISSTSIDERYGVYGHTKVLGEEIATTYAFRNNMNVITLRPRAFIPPWNRTVYSNFMEWAQWFSKGAVHISDVAQAVIKSIELLLSDEQSLYQAPLFLTVDGAYQYTEEDLENWDADGAGSTFKRHYKQFYDLAVNMGLDPHLKPTRLDISETQRILNYKPLYSMKTLLLELKMYGAAGPYADRIQNPE